MKLLQLLLLLVLAAGPSGCVTTTVESRYSYDTTVDFSVMRSFAMLPLDENDFSTPESTAHYRTAMVRALSAKGFTENPANPDFVIRTAPVGTFREEYNMLDAGTFSLGRASLRVSFLRPSSGWHIYEAVVESFLEESDSQESKNALLDDAVDQILRKFPPTTRDDL